MNPKDLDLPLLPLHKILLKFLNTKDQLFFPIFSCETWNNKELKVYVYDKHIEERDRLSLYLQLVSNASTHIE